MITMTIKTQNEIKLKEIETKYGRKINDNQKNRASTY